MALLVAMVLPASAQQINFTNDTGCHVWVKVTYRVGPNCPGSTPETTDCFQVPANNSAQSTIPMGNIFRGVEIYCSSGCNNPAAGVISSCSGGNTTFTCCSTTYTLEGDAAGGFRIY